VTARPTATVVDAGHALTTPDRPVLAYTTEDDEGSQRTALAAGLVRRRDLEFELDGLWAVVLGENRSPPAPGTA
jgi:hypothetical protein